ncbi:MAG: MATE family efflux transporter [Firmicutes bacterium]|nr:MATE family efflux transporter [Bacillota bacterium]
MITNRQKTWQQVGMSALALGLAFSSLVGVASAKTQGDASLTKNEKFALDQAQVQEYKAPWWQMNSSTTFAASLGLTKYAKVKTEYTALLNQLVQQVGQSQVEYMTVHKGLVKGEPAISILDRQINSASGKTATQIASKFGLGKMAYEDQGVGWKVIAGGVNSLIPTNDFRGLPFELTSMVGEHVVQAGSAFSVRGSVSAKDMALMAKMLVFTACITRLGTVPVAANEIALNILSLGFMPANGFGAAATICVGQEVGASRPLVARTVGAYTAGMGLLFMALFSVFLWVFAASVARVYTSDVAVSALAVSLIHIASFIQLFDGGGIILAGGLRGIGDTTFLFRMALIQNWVVFIPLTLLLTIVFHFGQAGAWIALCTLIVLIGVTNAWRYWRLDWRQVASRSTMGEMAVPLTVV